MSSDEDSPEAPIDVFKNALADDDIEVEKGAASSLTSVALLFGEEKTRNELLPFLHEHITNITEEVQVIIAEQLGKYLPLIGGEENSGVVLQILTRLCLSDETLVREQAEESIKIIAKELSKESCENFYIPIIHDLASSSWFSVKCSASALFEVCYLKASEESRSHLRAVFRNLLQDENPLVRKASALNLIDFLKVLEPEHINLEFMPVLDHIKEDVQDNVKPLAVDIGITIAKILQKVDVNDHVLNIIEEFSNNESWKIRHKVASSIPEIQIVFGQDKNRGKILGIFQSLTVDSENEVKISAAQNLFDYCKALKESYDKSAGENNFEPVFVQSIIPYIRHLLDDYFEDIVLSASSCLLSLSGILSTECFKTHILPFIIDLLENEETKQSVKENVLKNLNAIPVGINITDYIKSLDIVIRSLLLESKLHWRTRRNMLLFFIHISNYCTKEYFDSKLKCFYRALISDQIFAVRRTAAVILPLLVKSFGMQWAISSLVPIFLEFASNEKYLYRYITVTSINEIIFPTVENDRKENTQNYLEYFKQFNQEKISYSLAIIEILNSKLLTELASETYCDFLSNYDTYNSNSNENIKIYTEDTLDLFKKNQKNKIFSISEQECNKEDISYLEGVLLLCNKQYLSILKKLCEDPIYNVQMKAKYALNSIKIFADKIDQELHESWVQDCLKKLSSEDFVKIKEQIKEKLKNIIHEDLKPKEQQPMEIDNIEIKNIDENLIITSSEEPLPDLGSEVLDLEIHNEQKLDTVPEKKSEDQNNENDVKNDEKIMIVDEAISIKPEDINVIKETNETISHTKPGEIPITTETSETIKSTKSDDNIVIKETGETISHKKRDDAIIKETSETVNTSKTDEAAVSNETIESIQETATNNNENVKTSEKIEGNS